MRGRTESVQERQRVYVDDFRDAAPVLDVGCGRGELLALLKDAGVEARGVDADSDMVAFARGEGLDVEQADAVSYLGVARGRLARRASSWARSSSTCRRRCSSARSSSAQKLREGGLLIAETINPLSPLALRNYFADLTHAQPLVPETLAVLARQVGLLAGRDAVPQSAGPGRGRRARGRGHPVRAARLRDHRAPMRILVCSPQVPFARGGAEILAERLTHELNERGHEADLVTMPFKWYPGTKVLTNALMWRLADLTEVDGRPIDLVIGTKFPSYVVKHPNKVVWLVHQFRQAYELDRTELGSSPESDEDRALRRAIHRLDKVALGEARKLGAISQNVADRVKRNTGLDAEVILPPPQQLDFRCDSYDDFVLSVNRLDRAKRIDLALEAAAADGSMRLVIAGDGPDRERLDELAKKKGLNGRVTFAGASASPSSPISTRGAAASTTRPSTRITAWCRTKRSWRRSPS